MTKVSLRSNQYAVTISEDVTVYLYSIEYSPVELSSELIDKALNCSERELDKHFKIYAANGYALIAAELLEEDVEVTARVQRDFQVKLKILANSRKERRLKDLERDEGEINQAVQQLIQIFLRKAMKKQNMEQVGNTPKFFNVNQMEEVVAGRDGEILQLFPGLKVSPWLYGNNLFISVDVCHKFIPKIDAYGALQAMQNDWQRRNYKMIKDQGRSDKVEAFKEFFMDGHDSESIVTNYGTNRAYKIAGFEPEVNLEEMTFERMHDGE